LHDDDQGRLACSGLLHAASLAWLLRDCCWTRIKKLTRVVEDGNPAKAIKPLKEIIAKEPDNFAAHVCLGRA
jgi:hypothetical protein